MVLKITRLSLRNAPQASSLPAPRLFFITMKVVIKGLIRLLYDNKVARNKGPRLFLIMQYLQSRER